MPANRVAVLGAVLAAIGGFLTALLGAFSSELAKAIVASVALLVFALVIVVYLIGWQKHEARSVTDEEELLHVPTPETAATPDPVT